MNKQSTPQFLVFGKRKHSADPQVHLYLRISYNDTIHEKSLGIKCRYHDWDPEQMIISGQPVDTHNLILKLEELKQKVMGAYYLLKQTDGDMTVREIIDVAQGEKKPGSMSFIQCFQEIVSRMEKSKGQDGNSDANIQKHKRCLLHFQTFCRKYYNTSDLAFHKINKITIDELSEYLKTEGSCSHNTSMKYMQIIKKVYRMGIDNGWVKVNAFANFKFRMKTIERDCLTEDELEIIQKKHFKILRLNYVKDIFLFSCYSGLAYIDIKNLKRYNIIENQGMLWIKSKRTKTGVEASIPLLPPAKEILDRRCQNWLNYPKDCLLFEVISNQKMNAYLKEIAEICKIDKVITFHLARHTFATTIALLNKVPLETVSKMLGHSRITMTQHYSKVIDLKIERDTQQLFNKLNNDKLLKDV